MDIQLPEEIINDSDGLCDVDNYGFSAPIECPSRMYRLMKPKLFQDKCVKCPKGYSVEVKQTSFRPKKLCTKTNEECPLDNTESSTTYPNISSCLLKCRCSLDKCAYGDDPCACNFSEECDIDYYLSDDGRCTQCPKGYSKPERGCHKCIETNQCKRYTLYAAVRERKLLRRKKKRPTFKNKKRRFLTSIQFKFACYSHICTFPYEFCDVYVTRRCARCALYSCNEKRKLIPTECGFYC